MLVKVYRGTRIQEAENLCHTCRHAHIIRGTRDDDEIIMCGAAVMRTTRITFKVTECTEYLDHREPSYHELYEQAWILRRATRRRPAGFVRPKERDAALRRFRVDPVEDE
jgi:hypothetical protein